MELKEVIDDLASDLFEFVSWDVGEGSADEALNARVWQKFPGF